MRFMVDPAVPSSSIMESVQRSLDTVPRRVAFRRAMPEFISQSFMRREAQERLANANWLFTLAAMQAVARTEAKVGLAAVERGELRSADVNHMHYRTARGYWQKRIHDLCTNKHRLLLLPNNHKSPPPVSFRGGLGGTPSRRRQARAK